MAHKIMVELERYEIATLLSVARNDNLAAGGAAALGDGPHDQRLVALHMARGDDTRHSDD